MARAIVSIEEIVKALHREFSLELGEDASGRMIYIQYRTHDEPSEPNWDAIIQTEVPEILGAFLVALRRVRDRYDVNDDDQVRLRR